MHLEKCPDKGPKMPQEISNLLGSERKLYRRVTFELNLKEGGEGAQQAGKAFHIEGTEHVPAKPTNQPTNKKTRSTCL